MGAADLRALAPLLVLVSGTVLVMLLAAFRRVHSLAAGASALVLALAIAALPFAAREAPRQVTALIRIDAFGLVFIGVVCAAALAATLLAWSYMRAHSGPREELYVLLLTATLGAAALVSSSHFASLFLGLEVLSVSLVALTGYLVRRRRPLEAALKYLVLSGASSALLLFGGALIYFRFGTLGLHQIAVAAAQAPGDAVLLAGYALILVGLGFKLSLVPFHFWTPDVYQGAPAPVTAFLSTVSKASVAALLLRFLIETHATQHWALSLALELMAAASILVGNLLALRQRDLKRLLAYSSIAHLGYLLIAFVAAGPFGAEAVAYYLVAYVVMTLAAFGVVSHLSAAADGADMDALERYRGLFWRRPWPASVLAAALLSLAGMPVSAGFMAKFYVFAAGVAAGLWPLLVVLVAGSVLGLFYYLRAIGALFDRAGEPAPQPPARFAVAGTLALAALTVLLVVLGAYPQPAIALVSAATGGLY